MSYSLGLDIGSVSVKLAVLDNTNNIIHLEASKITSGPRSTVHGLINGLSRRIDLSEIKSAGVSGIGKSLISSDLGWSEYSSSLAIASGLLNSHPDARTIFQIGGQSSLVIELEDGLTKPWKVASNPLCAAGTGRFLEQQAYRLGIEMDDFASMALKCAGNAPRIAARCSVFAKSDLIHLQQRGIC